MHYIELYLQCIELQCIALHWIALHCSVHCIALCIVVQCKPVADGLYLRRHPVTDRCVAPVLVTVHSLLSHDDDDDDDDDDDKNLRFT